MAAYRFLTTWLLDAQVGDVWDTLYAAERWPEWWRGVESVDKLVQGDEDGVGSVYRNRWRSVLPYTVRFDARTTVVDRPRTIEVVAMGELEGRGTWRLFAGDLVAVTYEWNVRTTLPWMNALAPLVRPLFAWNHDVVMWRGGEGLARRLGTRLLARG